MKVIAVVGSGSGVGKTTLVCRLLREQLGLGAVKISPRDVSPRIEWGPGDGDATKDTTRYAASGAARVARILAPRASVSRLWGELVAGMNGCKALVIEGYSALGLGDHRMGILVVNHLSRTPKSKDIGIFLHRIDVIVRNYPTLIDRSAVRASHHPHCIDDKVVIESDLENEEDQGFLEILSRVRYFIQS